MEPLCVRRRVDDRQCLALTAQFVCDVFPGLFGSAYVIANSPGDRRYVIDRRQIDGLQFIHSGRLRTRVASLRRAERDAVVVAEFAHHLQIAGTNSTGNACTSSMMTTELAIRCSFRGLGAVIEERLNNWTVVVTMNSASQFSAARRRHGLSAVASSRMLE